MGVSAPRPLARAAEADQRRVACAATRPPARLWAWVGKRDILRGPCWPLASSRYPDKHELSTLMNTPFAMLLAVSFQHAKFEVNPKRSKEYFCPESALWGKLLDFVLAVRAEQPTLAASCSCRRRRQSHGFPQRNGSLIEGFLEG